MNKFLSLALLPFLAHASLAQEAKPKTQIIILENDNVMEGRVEKDGNWYRIARTLGETVIPAEKVLKVVENREEAYKFLVKRANLRDPDERVRLAKWCMSYDLRTEAVEQAEAALKLRPLDPYADFVIKMVKNLPPIAAEAAEAKRTAPVLVDSALPSDLNQETIPGFLSKVQPILMNACASCHAGSAANGKFSLVRVYASTDKRGTLANLQEVLKQIDRTDLDKSPILAKAISAHGTLKNSPLRGKQSAAYRHLEEWVTNAMPKSAATTAAAVPKTVEPPKMAQEAEPLAVSKPLGAAPVSIPVESTPKTKAVEPIDPFDPEEFNKQKKK